MLSASILDNSTWRMVLHNALNGRKLTVASGWFWRSCKTKSFSIADIKEVLGLSQTEFTNAYNQPYNIFRIFVHLKDGRYCFLEAWQIKFGDSTPWANMGSATFSKNLKELMLSLDANHLEKMKMYHYL